MEENIEPSDQHIIPEEVIGNKIFIIRGHKVMLDRDLAELYGISAKRLNEQVKRNEIRFPIDFMFQLSRDEYGRLRSQIATSNVRRGGARYLPYAFTEHGVAMLSCVLKSERAVKMSIFIVRAFIKMRELLATNKDLAHKIDELERTQKEQGGRLASVYSVVKQLMNTPVPPKGKMGFEGR